LIKDKEIVKYTRW